MKYKEALAALQVTHDMNLELIASNAKIAIETRKKLKEIKEYCLPHKEYMWAARILGIIKGCGFREAASDGPGVNIKIIKESSDLLRRDSYAQAAIYKLINTKDES